MELRTGARPGEDGAMCPIADRTCCAAVEAFAGIEDVGAFTRIIQHLSRVNRMARGLGLTVVPGALADETLGCPGFLSPHHQAETT